MYTCLVMWPNIENVSTVNTRRTFEKSVVIDKETIDQRTTNTKKLVQLTDGLKRQDYNATRGDSKLLFLY